MLLGDNTVHLQSFSRLTSPKSHELLLGTLSQCVEWNNTRELATGEFYLGVEALELGLVDELGDKNTAEEFLKNKLNITDIEFKIYEHKPSFIEAIAGIVAPQSFMVGRGIGSELKKVSTSKRMEILT